MQAIARSLGVRLKVGFKNRNLVLGTPRFSDFFNFSFPFLLVRIQYFRHRVNDITAKHIAKKLFFGLTRGVARNCVVGHYDNKIPFE